jgi:hypothetical protein
MGDSPSFPLVIASSGQINYSLIEDLFRVAVQDCAAPRASLEIGGRCSLHQVNRCGGCDYN